MHKLIKNHAEYDATNDTKLREITATTDESFAAYVFLENADKNRYNSLLKGLHSQYSLNNKQFPQTMINAHNVLSNHRWDKNINKNKYNENNNDTSLSFTQNRDTLCFVCGKKGHSYKTCLMFKDNKTPKDEWWINLPENKDTEVLFNKKKKKIPTRNYF